MDPCILPSVVQNTNPVQSLTGMRPEFPLQNSSSLVTPGACCWEVGEVFVILLVLALGSDNACTLLAAGDDDAIP